MVWYYAYSSEDFFIVTVDPIFNLENFDVTRSCDILKFVVSDHAYVKLICWHTFDCGFAHACSLLFQLMLRIFINGYSKITYIYLCSHINLVI